MTAMLEATAVTRRFGEFTANHEIDLHVGAGEIVGLLGANGAGKTTFMRMVLGLLRPSSGAIRLFGGPATREARRRIGYVPQGLGLYEDLTVAENLQFATEAFGSTAIQLGDPELAAYSGTLVHDLPLGLQRRLVFAASLGHKPELCVLDEPTSGVDPLGRSRLWDAIHTTAAGGSGVLVSTHYMGEAEHCDRVAVLAEGRVVAAGTLDDIVGGRQALQVTGVPWDQAFQALDAAGLTASLHGQAVRVLDANRARVAGALRSAGLEGRLSAVPATFEEAFVGIVTTTKPA